MGPVTGAAGEPEPGRTGAGGPGTAEYPRIATVGFCSALLALLGTAGYVLSVPLQLLALTGPIQTSVIAYGSSLTIAPAFLLLMVALHHTVPVQRQFWTHAATLFAGIYATLASVNYVVQLTTVLPAGYSWTPGDQAGTPGPLSVLNQTPHSLMWDIDGLGYIFLNVATLLAALAFARDGPGRRVRRILLTNAAITPLFAVTYYWPSYSVAILLIGGVPWAVTVPASLLSLALYFRTAALTHRGCS